MKKVKLLILIAALFFANVANAQFDFCLGPKVGYQTQSISLKSADIKNSFENNITFGVFGRITIGKFIVQPELLYFKTGKVLNFKKNINIGEQGINVKPKITINQSNLSLPIMLGYQFVDNKLLKMRANVGPIMYFVVDSEQKVSVEDVPTSIGIEEPTIGNIETKNFTWGAGLNLGADIWRFTIDINYSFGLSNLFGTDNVKWSFNEHEDEIHLDKIKQNIFTITLGFKFL